MIVDVYVTIAVPYSYLMPRNRIEIQHSLVKSQAPHQLCIKQCTTCGQIVKLVKLDLKIKLNFQLSSHKIENMTSTQLNLNIMKL